MSVDWNELQAALQQSRDGHNLKALAVLSRLMQDAETDSDRAAIVLGEASCHSQLGNVTKSRELLASAKTYAQGDRIAMSQVALSEASLYAQEKQYDLACEKFASVKSEYRDLLVQPEHDDFALELDSQLGCALVDAGSFSEAVLIFREIFKREQLDDKQRLQLFFGVALMRTGQSSEAQTLLFAAAKGKDAELSQRALECLSEIEPTQ
jgi:tetratricopeptide (TPR) repeat protein